MIIFHNNFAAKAASSCIMPILLSLLRYTVAFTVAFDTYAAAALYFHIAYARMREQSSLLSDLPYNIPSCFNQLHYCPYDFWQAQKLLVALSKTGREFSGGGHIK
ncbi:hypothetical protein BDV29DRAFT_71816 [Aspergillus leporis]|jgi:hypothetical protein|uniref:Uncharacterized protein n=1 Tax=Aspergillus leporis TaxID=41062 RepID=A0A5N5WIJ2_9EURO|nr:hypothetical protein BDV29DRAFT_71816 [Aspergillus leporis]